MAADFSGSNADEILRERASRRIKLLDDIADLQTQLKDFKDEDKHDGFSEKALGQIIREQRKGIEYQCDQLMLELELHTYRKAVGLPTDLEFAQKAVRDEVEAAPKVKSAKGKENKRGGLN